ncbi:hypothetical protein JOQ06_018043 [Pogonophryne albipinna]|uniref:PHD-type domain-containing protein n=1 Tax=Pogonophryne albipinna TaxID=1090488 RepID=A0AAD6AHM5_9TELE|nr:hypothetical protein JOQ06_018043 [Pogonophryne albipinna]
MAAPVLLRSSGPPLCPSFAEVCSFLERYGAVMDLPEMTFPQMERYLRDTTTVPKPLVELHVKLLRKLGRSVTTDRWEKYLVCQELNSTWAWELEQKGYQELSMECKSCILKYLCECQFDDNLKFKMAINEEDPEKMRLQPIGRDQQGLMYWLQLDPEQNIRLYTEEQDDLDGSTWKCIVRNRTDLAEALELLKGQTGAGGEAVGGTKTPEEHTDSGGGDLVKAEEHLTEVIQLEHTQPGNTEVKEEKTEHISSPVFDNRVSTITTVIKSESRDTDNPKNAVSVVMAPGATVTKQEVNKEEEVERAVVTRSEQAKIPLKKRELKLAESFSNHLKNSSSSIIVCNPSVIQAKAPPPSQQLLVTASSQELSNGRAPLPPPHKEGHNGVIGVIGQVGVIGHVGVIRSPLERHRATGAEQQELNGPSLDQRGGEDREVSRQSVLVRKGAAEGETMTAAAASAPPAPAAMDTQTTRNQPLPSLKCVPLPDAAESPSSLPLPSEDPQGHTAEDQGQQVTEEQLHRERKTGHSSEEREEGGSVSGCPVEEGGSKDDQEDKSTLAKVEAEPESISPTLRKVDQEEKKEPQGGGGNCGTAAQVRVKDTGLASGERQGPLEEASSELQKEGIRLKIKIPPHRRSKLRGKGGKEGQKERGEEEVQDEGRMLRRSSRICRSSALPNCRPSSKASESQRKKPKETQKEGKKEPVGQIRKRRGKRRHRRPRWSNIQELPSEDACSHCGLPNHPELILLCDSCDSGYHTACLRPPLMLIPDGQWFCPPCQHKLLCEKLEEHLLNLDSALKKRERAERRRERLVYVGISVENIIPEGDEVEEEKTTKKKDPKKSKHLGRRSTRTRKHISYRFDDFDDAIDEAIDEDIRDLCGGARRGRNLTAILSEEGKESQRPIRGQAHAARNRKRRRLNDLESDSTAAESEDEFMLSNSSEEEEFGRGAPKPRPGKTQRRGRKRLRRRRRRSSEEEEETEEEMGSDQFSDMTDSDDDKNRRGLRRGQRQQVNYRETSESSDASRASAKKVGVRPRGRPCKEHLSSDYSDVTPSSRDSEEDNYEDLDDDDRRRRANKRRREEEDPLRKRTRGRPRRNQNEEDERERGRRLKRKRLEKEKDRDKRKRVKRTNREEEDLEKMGRGRRREILSQQRRKRLAQMLKKRRPSTDEEEDEDEDSESESSSEEDRPVRKRLNRIDSDDEEEDREEEETMKKCSEVERRTDSDTQEKRRGRSLSPSNRHRTPSGPEEPGAEGPAAPRDRAEPGCHNGPSHQEGEGGEGQTLNSVQNSPQS